MKPFHSVRARVAVIDRPDVDTDQILPGRFLKKVERTGYGDLLFCDWRQDPDFELNRPEYAGAGILVAGCNFGCGSSREHAAWALRDYGFEVLIAPSFGDIFAANCGKVGLVTIVLPPEQVRELAGAEELAVDLEAQAITGPGGTVWFDFDPALRHRLLNGLDEIDLTLEREDAIARYESAHPALVDTSALP